MGVFTAVVTPFKKDLQIDRVAFESLIRRQIAAGVAGIIPCGTTAEAPALSIDEKCELVQITLDTVKRSNGHRPKVFVGTGSASTRETVEFSRWASEQGADGGLVVTPYYVKPSPAGMRAHFEAVAEAVSCEVMLYNVPGRTGVSLTPKTIVELAAHPKIRSIKEAAGNIAFLSEVIDALDQAGRSLTVYTGDDPTFLAALSVGATGIVSVASNLIPAEMVSLDRSFASGEWADAQTLHRQYFPLFRDLFVESNPVPVKHAMSLLGLCDATVRPPLATLSAESEGKLMAALTYGGVLA
jgi:4-hydroxy-tetrahydrodipicolinate synthase